MNSSIACLGIFHEHLRKKPARDFSCKRAYIVCFDVKRSSAASSTVNAVYKAEIKKVSPHVCRHTYCSNMAKAGINPKALQYLMGHSDIAITLNVYTHIKYEDAKEELCKLSVGGVLQPPEKE